MRKLLILAITLLGSASLAGAATLVVPTQYPTIQAAVNAAHTGDVVLVNAGVYSDVTHEAGGGDTTKCAVVMKSGITLRGAGVGLAVIDANSRGRGIHCFGVTNATIEGFTIREAFAQVHGAAIFCKEGSSPTIRNCEITANLDGGIICFRDSSPVITGCRMTHNAAKEGGGLAADTNCSPRMTDCVITDNVAPSGGGVFARAASVMTIQSCIISKNKISQINGSGGGIGIASSQMTVENSYIDSNVSSGGGGGVYSLESVVLLRNCSIQGDSTKASYGPGGGIYVDFHSDVTIENCTIARNVVEGTDNYSDGGGIAAYFATNLVIRQSTISANSSALAQGGGISSWFCDPIIEKCIISHNSPGEGLYCVEGSSVPVVSCTDLFGNAGGNGICGTDAGHNFSLDPLFCNLAGNDFRLQSGSPCAPGNHPQGPTTCDGSRLGGKDLGCAPVEVPPGAPAVEAARLQGNEPNPFRPPTSIRFDLPRDARATLRIFDVAGRLVRTLEDRSLQAGPHQVTWDGRTDGGILVPSGIYFYRLSTEGIQQTRHMVLTR